MWHVTTVCPWDRPDLHRGGGELRLWLKAELLADNDLGEAFDVLTDLWAQEKESGRLTPERQAAFDAALGRLFAAGGDGAGNPDGAVRGGEGETGPNYAAPDERNPLIRGTGPI